MRSLSRYFLGSLLVIVAAGLVICVYILASLSATSDRLGDGAASFGILQTQEEGPVTPADKRSLRNAIDIAPYPRFRTRQLAHRPGSLWVFASDRSLCLAQPKAASCAPMGEAIREGVFLGTFAPPNSNRPYPHDFVLQGVLPDNVRQVVVVLGRRRRLVVEVTNNVVSLRWQEPIRVARLRRG